MKMINFTCQEKISDFIAVFFIVDKAGIFYIFVIVDLLALS